MFHRAAEDVGNIVEFGHVNTRVPDQRLATLFYIIGLGLTRDPFERVGIDNMWANIGSGQFHLPTGPAQVLRGVTGLVLPNLEALPRRLEKIAPDLAGTAFDFRRTDTAVEVTSPWGNRLRCHAPDPARFGPINRGIPYVEIDVAEGAAPGIVGFYRQLLGSPAEVAEDAGGRFARVPAGVVTVLLFRETAATLPPFDGHHIQITLADFSGPHRRLLERDLITEESDQHQYRFERLVDPASNAVVAILEHEVRSMRHPMYGRPLVNRDPH
jgi:hypothetical protein